MSKQRQILEFKNTIFMSASAIVFLALAGCNLDSDTVDTMGGLNLGTETLAAATVSAAGEGAREDLMLADANNTFGIISTDIVEATNTINVMLRGDTDNADRMAIHGPPLASGGGRDSIDDDGVDVPDFVAGDGNSVAGDGTNRGGVVTLSLSFRDDVPSGSPFGDQNAPEWTEVEDRRYLYYRNRARRSQNTDGFSTAANVISRGDANYAEYHAMAYITNPDQDNNRQELVRVEVIYLNYNDGVDTLQGRGQANFNALETADSDKIALGIATAVGTQTANRDLPSGRAQYAGYYLGQNRIRATVTGRPGEIDAKENNIPTMTLSFDFDDADGSFRINDARLKTDPDGTDTDDRIDVTMDISGTITSLTTNSESASFEGGITQLDVSGELTLFDDQDDEQSLSLNQRFYIQSDADRAEFRTVSDGANSLTGQFFNDGESLGHIVAGTIDADLEITSPVSITDQISYSFNHYMLGVFIAERYTAP